MARRRSRGRQARLKAGEMLDGEGGYTVYAKLIPAARSRKLGGLPIGLPITSSWCATLPRVTS